MTSLLIKDTTLEERKQIVADALNYSAGDCDGQDFSGQSDRPKKDISMTVEVISE